MSLIKDRLDTVALECDECNETTEEYGWDEFNQMVRDAKADGWLIRPGREGWTHICPACQGESRLDRARRMFSRQEVR